MTAALTPEQAYLATVAELNTLAERSKHVTHEDVLRIASMSADELRRRAIVALDWHSCFSHCLDGMPELKAIPGGAPDGCWLPRAVRGVVEALLRRSDLTFEDTSHGRRKSPSPEAQRIEALEAELAACKRDAERYQHARMAAVRSVYPRPKGCVRLLLEFPQDETWDAEQDAQTDLDCAIDAAMAAGEKA